MATMSWAKFVTAYFNSKVVPERRVTFRQKLNTQLVDIAGVEYLKDNDVTSKTILKRHWIDIKEEMDFPIQQNLEKMMNTLTRLDSTFNLQRVRDDFGVQLNAVNGELFYNSLPTREMLATFTYDMSKRENKTLTIK